LILLIPNFRGAEISRNIWCGKLIIITINKVAVAGFICYMNGDGNNAATYSIRGHHVSKDFKIDKEWKDL
jgi:hypothetical protein